VLALTVQTSSECAHGVDWLYLTVESSAMVRQ